MRRTQGFVGAVLLAVTMSGCWLQAGFDSSKTANNGGETTINADNVDLLDVAWTADVGDLAQEAPVNGGSVFVRSDGAVTALDVGTGGQQWTVSSTSAGPMLGTAVPAILDNTLRVPVNGAHANCAVVSLDLGTGGFLGADSTFFGAPINPDSWTTGCTTADALVANGGVFAPFNWGGEGLAPGGGCPTALKWQRYDGMAAVDPNNTIGFFDVVETSNGCGNLPPRAPLYGQETLFGDRVLVVHGSTLTAHPLAGCPSTPPCPSWSVDAGGTIVGPALALANGDIALSRSGGTLVVVDGTSHAVEWTSTPGAALAAPLAASTSSIFVTTSDGVLAALPIGGCGAATCSASWTVNLGSPASARPSIGGNVVYIGSADGSIRAVDARGCGGGAVCDILWSHDTGSRITGAPTIDNGTLLVGSENGTVTAFTLGGA